MAGTPSFKSAPKTTLSPPNSFSHSANSIGLLQAVLPQIILKEFGGERVVFGADLKDGVPATHGWTKSGEIPSDKLFEIFIANGLKHSIVTDIGRDGMLQGPSIELYRMLEEKFPELNIIASGGISSVADLYELEKINITEAIVGKALYEGKISLNDLYNLNK